MDIEVLGIDLGKTFCLAGRDEAKLLPYVVAMEASAAACHIGRFCVKNGHEPRSISPLYAGHV